MLNNFKDQAVQYVRTIVDSNRCPLCDKLDGESKRFVCGHFACVDCVAVTSGCSVCSLLMDAGYDSPKSDHSLAGRVKHATDLLTSFQNAFDIDVYQRQRNSDRLKVERELFPECIQAPAKYFNKRKSLHVSSKNKENSFSFFPGEEISSKRDRTMNKSSYVQEWLNKQTTPRSAPSRSPFSDIQVNTHHRQAAAKSNSVKGKEKLNAHLPVQQSNRKRSKLKKSLPSNVQSSLENYLTPVEKTRSKKTWMSTERLKHDLFNTMKDPGTGKVEDKNVADESGIVIDDCFIIEDSQTQIIDKDKLALLAVANADVQATTSSVVEVEDSQAVHDMGWGKDVQKNKLSTVPFYRKSYLFENCNQCFDDLVNEKESKLHDETLRNDTDISITVENKSFITTITVVDVHQSSSDQKQSISVQTDVESPFLGFEQTAQKEETVKMISKIQEYIRSEAVLAEGIVSDTDSQKTSCTNIIIARNKSENNLADGDMNIAKDHHTEHGHGILTECGAGFQNRKRKPPRGATPDSANSSDKENCDPNKKKKNFGKKKKKVLK